VGVSLQFFIYFYLFCYFLL